MGQIELFDIYTVCKKITFVTKLFEIEQFVHVSVCKEMTDV